jgi:hypothetical protein
LPESNCDPNESNKTTDTVSTASRAYCPANGRTHRVARRRFSLRWPRLLIAAALLAAAWPWSSTTSFVKAQDSETTDAPRERSDVPKEHTLKAVFLYSFGRYVEWPKTAFDTAKAPFVIGMLGEDLFGGALDEIAKKRTVQGRAIVIKRFANLAAYKPPCHILFVSRSLTGEEQAAVIAKTAGKPVLVVGETPGFAEHGGPANFVTDADRISIEINVDSARRAQLRIDARLLRLAKRVGVPPATAKSE